MATISLTKEWQEISTTSCLFQKAHGDDVVLFYGTAPTSTEEAIFEIAHGEVIVLPAPIVGSIHAKISNRDTSVLGLSSIVVVEI